MDPTMFLLLTLAACGPSRNPARETIDAEQAPRPAESGWTCPMHPEVHADRPGACPSCGMALVEAR